MSIWKLVQNFQRVEYSKAPLVEVIAQVRFPLNLSIEGNLAAKSKFQDLISDAFPEAKEVTGFQMTLSPEGPQQSNQARTIRFENEETGQAAILANNALTLSTSGYSDWKSFSATFLQLVDNFGSCFSVRSWNRIGLRYRNIVDPEGLGLGHGDWPRLVNPKLLGILDSELADDTELRQLGSMIELTYGLDKVLIQTGLAEKPGSPLRPFVIDFDFSTEEGGAFKDIEIRRVLENLHTYSGPLFRWSISEELHHALGPK